MTDAQIHGSELDNWCVVTRRFAELDDAMVSATELLHRTSRVVLQPVQKGWMVIAQLSMMN
jgi:hypothetical protein